MSTANAPFRPSSSDGSKCASLPLKNTRRLTRRNSFPSKQNPAHKNAALVQRVKELWDCNTSQRDMLKTLNDEGFDIKERELMRVRAKNRWLLRVPNGMKSKKRDSDQDVISQLQQALYPDGQMADAEAEAEAEDDPMEEMARMPPPPTRPRAESPPLSPEVMKKRQERLSKLQAESAERWGMYSKAASHSNITV
jgi:hypothetical protein